MCVSLVGTFVPDDGATGLACDIVPLLRNKRNGQSRLTPIGHGPGQVYVMLIAMMVGVAGAACCFPFEKLCL
jgi:hypothetical protein